jgi:hypothetical protein
MSLVMRHTGYMTTATATKATYRKTQAGEWVVCATAAMLTAGGSVEVTKADGTVKIEMIERVGKTFGAGLAYGYIAKATKATAPKTAKPAARIYTSTRCGECRGEIQSWADGRNVGLCHDCF